MSLSDNDYESEGRRFGACRASSPRLGTWRQSRIYTNQYTNPPRTMMNKERHFVRVSGLDIGNIKRPETAVNEPSVIPLNGVSRVRMPPPPLRKLLVCGKNVRPREMDCASSGPFDTNFDTNVIRTLSISMIDWSKLLPEQSTNNKTFEELCYQVAKGLRRSEPPSLLPASAPARGWRPAAASVRAGQARPSAPPP